jgi:hypothetical protein
MDWMTQYLDASERRDESLERCARRIKEAREGIWSKLADDLRRGLQHLSERKPGSVDDGGLNWSQTTWRIRRIDFPPYEVSVTLREYSIMIEHEFKAVSITPGEVFPTVVDFCCDDQEQVCLIMDGKSVDIPHVSRRILEPIVSGKRP